MKTGIYKFLLVLVEPKTGEKPDGKGYGLSFLNLRVKRPVKS